MDFVKKFQLQKVETGKILLAWAGQAGFLLKNSRGKILALDVYLSDLAERQDGNKRLMPGLFEAGGMDVDVILASHHHTDHLDMDTIPVWLEMGARLYCCNTSYEICEKAGAPMEQVTAMKPGDCAADSGFQVTAVWADHGDAAPRALGFLIESEGVRIYFTGDTSYQQRLVCRAGRDIDVLLLPINGEYGNMNEEDAVMLARQVEARLTIPCHFWTFARHQGNPYRFQQEMRLEASKCPVYLMAQGEVLTICAVP